MSDTELTRIGRYELLEEIGQGGMSVVYRATELATSEIVAIKVLSPYIAQEPRFKARFEREVGVLSNMDHPNIVPILNYGEEQGKNYIVMPYYGGGTLQDLIDRDYMDLREVASLLADIASGLEYAHRQGIVHRDIKPSNVVLNGEGRASLSDFGFAYVSESSHSLTGSVLIGTPAFMSPEQCAGHEVDSRSDQYSLGAVLYQATTGHLPYQAETPMGVVLKHVSEPLTRPRYFNPLLPDAVEAVIQRAMAKDPGLRYTSVVELSDAFEAALAESLDPKSGLPRPDAVGPTPETKVLVTEPEPSWGPRRTLAAIALLLIVALPAAAWGFNGRSGEGDGNGAETATPSAFLLATIEALSTANAERLEGSQEPGAVETAVAATIEAMGLFDTPTATASAVSVSPTPTPTTVATSLPGGGDGSDDGGSDSPPPPGPGATDPPSGPTNTPPPPSNTPAPPTGTPIPPTAPPEPTATKECIRVGHPQFPCTPVPEP